MAVVTTTDSNEADSAVSSTSTSSNRSGFSDWAERNSPHSGAWTRSGVSVPSTTTPLRVTTTIRVAPNRSSASHDCTTSSTSAVTDRT